MDTVSRQVRSSVMSKVKSKRNRSTEWRLRGLLVRHGLRGWQVNPRDLPGAPDFVFRAERLVIFTDGCFWHGCPRCDKVPSSNVSYWDSKIARNRKRDKATSAKLRRQGWTVLRFWEHDLASLGAVADRIEMALHFKPQRQDRRLLR
jgi:DNA mismatch endonuclease (patch repair protein)